MSTILIVKGECNKKSVKHWRGHKHITVSGILPPLTNLKALTRVINTI